DERGRAVKARPCRCAGRPAPDRVGCPEQGGEGRPGGRAMRPKARQAEPGPFPYGWRYETRKTEEGEKTVEVALTLEDVLHPREGGSIPEPPVPPADSTSRATVCASRRERLPPAAAVHSDLLTDFALAGVAAVSPDLAVFFGLKKKTDPQADLFHP